MHVHFSFNNRVAWCCFKRLGFGIGKPGWWWWWCVEPFLPTIKVATGLAGSQSQVGFVRPTRTRPVGCGHHRACNIVGGAKHEIDTIYWFVVDGWRPTHFWQIAGRHFNYAIVALDSASQSVQRCNAWPLAPFVAKPFVNASVFIVWFSKASWDCCCWLLGRGGHDCWSSRRGVVWPSGGSGRWGMGRGGCGSNRRCGTGGWDARVAPDRAQLLQKVSAVCVGQLAKHHKISVLHAFACNWVFHTVANFWGGGCDGRGCGGCWHTHPAHQRAHRGRRDAPRHIVLTKPLVIIRAPSLIILPVARWFKGRCG